ncbi:MAG: aminoglycoside phosphotransferase family protein [Ruminococcaceae bacterium]|nr:aminoglycoside phosphotransferase family protein [Oscillospiraceae bacterium]
MNLNYVFGQFATEAEIAPYGNGHINDTYCVEPGRFILQRINTNIFKNPDELMQNIENVTAHLREKIIASGGDPERETLTVIKTRDGKNYFEYEGSCFRLYKFIEGTKTVETDKTMLDLYNAGKGFGKFQNLLADFPVDKLFETIVDFHHTPKRVEALKTAIKEDKAGRLNSVKEEVEFALSCAEFAATVTDGIEKGEIPVRVTHNDTKINNILFDAATNEATCVIDLDTVMPGSVLYDFGDTLRMGASTGAEDEVDLSKVWFDKETFEIFAKGFLEETSTTLNEREIELLPFSAKLMTYECGIRFLTDYLNGDTYFKIHREHHNLDRARNQFKLVRDIAEKEEELNAIVKKIIENI